MSQAQSITPIPSTPPPSRRANRPPRINIHNLTGGSAMSQSSMPPSAQPPYTAQTNYTGNGTQGPYWPPMANPFGSGNFMTKGYEGFLDLTKTGMSFGEKFTFGMYNKLSKLSRRWFTHIFLIIILALYNVGGALLFKAIEVRQAEHEKAQLQNQQKLFFDDMRSIATNTTLKGVKFDAEVLKILNKYSSPVESLLRDQMEKKPDPWSFWDAMVYAATIYTTIGYGHITPKTDLGRSLTIVYAIIGIPMFLIVLADLGKLFTRCVKFLWAYVRRVYYTRSCRRIRKQQQFRDAMTGFNTVYDMAIRRPSMFFGKSSVDQEDESGADAEAGRTSLGTSHPETPTSPYPETFEVDDEFNLPVSVASLLLISYILLGTFGFKLVETEWRTLDAFYYVFISMSTIGFGDLVPGNAFYVMASMIYLIFGLALTSMFINVVQIKLSDHFKTASAKVGATIGMNMASEFGDEGGSQVKTPSEMASVHGSRLDRIEEDGQEASQPPLTSILRPPRPLSPTLNGGGLEANGGRGGDGEEDVSPPPLLPRRQVSVDPQPPAEGENKKKKKHRFF
ncbi:potassium channel subfamily K member 4 isoform X3 [Drosophila eugracilis]|uniref:potassium channel subfamily K member 4 isoform X3 n=1 Tax=Drosophila eugracilis TaxID=29029 RepID=UPI0007E82BC4|nr:potassium channel subfamily K member 4 isoform X3 [Drosophila eugracilis]